MTNNNLLIPNQIIKSKRKSISLVIKNNGEFIVRAPINCKEADIISFINAKANWIITKRNENINNNIKPISFNEEDEISILGEKYNFQYSNKKTVKIEENKILLPKANTQEKFIAFLKRYAKKIYMKGFNSFHHYLILNIQICLYLLPKPVGDRAVTAIACISHLNSCFVLKKW